MATEFMPKLQALDSPRMKLKQIAQQCGFSGCTTYYIDLQPLRFTPIALISSKLRETSREASQPCHQL